MPTPPENSVNLTTWVHTNLTVLSLADVCGFIIINNCLCGESPGTGRERLIKVDHCYSLLSKYYEKEKHLVGTCQN